MLSFKTVRDDISNFSGTSIFIQEGNLIVKNVVTEGDRIQAYHLRHRIFCHELGWVPKTKNALEIDDYDKKAIFFGVFEIQNNKLLAFSRLIMPGEAFMIEKEFLFLVGPEYRIRKEDDTSEVSRLCIAPEARRYKISHHLGIHSISMLLYKGIYHWCIRNNIRYLYLVVEQKIYRLLSIKGFRCKLVGEPKVMPDKIIAVAAIMDWRKFEAFNAVKRPKMLRFFQDFAWKKWPLWGSSKHNKGNMLTNLDNILSKWSR